VTAIVELDPRTDLRWRDLVERAGGSLFHSPEWTQVLTDTYAWAPRAFVSVRAGAPVAGIAWCRVSDPGGERVVSLPFTDYCGPIGEPPYDAVLDAVDALGLPTRIRVLADGAGALDAAAPLGPRTVATTRWHGIDVAPDPAAVWSRMTSSARRAVRKARREGVVVEERADVGFVPRFLRLHTGVRKAKYGMLPQPRAFFDALRARFAPLGAWHPLAAVRDDRVLAATLYLRWGDTLYYKFNASDATTLECRPNDLLMWAGIELASRLGCRRVDLGASDDDQPGLIRFKRGYADHEREIQVRISGPPPPRGATRWRSCVDELAQRFTDPAVPDDLTEHAGDLLYRYFA
jgi:CelD/BcsL family acetyltransferase involved in cellulose biosynthesis